MCSSIQRISRQTRVHLHARTCTVQNRTAGRGGAKSFAVRSHRWREVVSARVFRQAARAFRHERLPAFLAYFERSLTENPMGHDWIVGDGCTTLDLSLFQVMRGLRYAFPNAMRLIWQVPLISSSR